MKRILSSRKGGFTLLELLVVIVIIGILAALLLPAIAKAINKARVNKVQAQVFQLASAFRNFQGEYGIWPNDTATDQPVDTTLLQALTGENTTINPRRIVFFEPEAKYRTSSGYVDFWGERYWVKFDQTYTGGLVPPDGSTTNKIPAGVVVWSYGTKGPTAPASEWIKTW